MHTFKMTKEQLFVKLKESFLEIVNEQGLSVEKIDIRSRALSVEEAIGKTTRKDYPIITGKEVLLQAEYMGAVGQAFTDSPADFSGTLEDITQLDIVGDAHARGLFIASLNAVMRYFQMAKDTIHCKNEEPELCAKRIVQYIKDNYGNPQIALVGFQPALIENISKEFVIEVLDLNQDNIGKEKYGVNIKHGKDDYKEVMDWAQLILCTGSTLSNGSIVDYMGIGKEVLFYGTTVAGAAEILGLKRICFCES